MADWIALMEEKSSEEKAERPREAQVRKWLRDLTENSPGEWWSGSPWLMMDDHDSS